MPNPTKFDILHDISPGKHFYQFYKNSEDFLQVMIPYFQSGLEKGDACAWLVSNKTGFEQMHDAAEAAFEKFSVYTATGQFKLLRAEDWYLSNGQFDEAKAMKNVADYLTDIQKLGYQTLRIAGDEASIPRTDLGKFHEYELKVASWIAAQPVIALCAYPILHCTPSQTRDILQCHDDVLIGRF